MQLRNSSAGFGLIAIALHWVVALTIIGLFALGFWMVDLTYYDSWYKQAPDIHRSIGILLFATMIFRLGWRIINASPAPLPSHGRWEVVIAHGTHWVLYLLIFVAMVSGYLISTADGSSVSVFGWFEMPSVTGRIKGMEDTAGAVHYWSTWALVALAGMHGLAAIKHHVIDKDRTLKRMLSPAQSE